MPEHDPHDQTDPAGESFDHLDDESAVPTDQGAHSADSDPAPPAADSSRAEDGDIDQSLSRIDKLADTLVKLSQASADDGFNAKIRQLTRKASGDQDAPADQPAFVEPTEQIQEPVVSPVESPPQPQMDEPPPAAPDIPVESTVPVEPTDEQIDAPSLSEPENSGAPLDLDEILQPLEAFAPSEPDDITTSSDDESFDDAAPQQPEPEDTWLTSEDDSPEVTTTAHEPDQTEIAAQDSSSIAQTPPSDSDAPPELSKLDPIAPEQEFAVHDEHSHADESDPDVRTDVEEEALGSASDSNLDAEVFDAPLESVDDVQAESSDGIPIGETPDMEEQSMQDLDPPAEMFEPAAQELAEPGDALDEIEQDRVTPSLEQSDSDESPNVRPDAFGDIEATSIGADQPDESVVPEQDAEAEPITGVRGEAEDHEGLADSVSDASKFDNPGVFFTAEELESQIGEVVGSSEETPQVSRRRPLPRAAASNLADGSASSTPETDIDLNWLARELDDLLGSGAAEPASGQQSQSSEVDDPVIEGAVDQEVAAPELSARESPAPDESSSGDDVPEEVAAASVDVGGDFDEIAAEQAEAASEINAAQPTELQEELAPAEPVGGETSIEDKAIETAPAEPFHSAGDDPNNLVAPLDDPLQSDVASLVQDSEPKAPTQETLADKSPEQTALDSLESAVDELSEGEAEATKALADESPEVVAADESTQTNPPLAVDATEPDESATAADDELSEITAQLDELLDENVEASADRTSSDAVVEASPAIDTAPPPEEPVPTGDMVEDLPEIDAPVSPESTAVDEPDDFMASPAVADASQIDEAPVTEVDQQMDEGVGSTVDTTEGDAADDPEAPTFMSETEPEDAASTEAEDRTSTEADASAEEPDTAGEPNALDAESAGEAGTDFMMNDSDLAEDDAPPEAEAVDGESEGEADQAPEDEALPQPDAQSQDRADARATSSKDDDDETGVSPTEELKDAAIATVRLVRLHEALERIEPVAVPILRRVNYPLRYVPKALRPIVDWVALSLLFWVPIVWVIALLAS